MWLEFSLFEARRVEDPLHLRLSPLFCVKWKETLVVGRVTLDIPHLLDTPLLVASYLHGPSGSPDHSGLSQGPFVGRLLRAVGDVESVVASPPLGFKPEEVVCVCVRILRFS